MRVGINGDVKDSRAGRWRVYPHSVWSSSLNSWS